MSSFPSLAEYMRRLTTSAEVGIDLSKPLKLYLRSTELVFRQAAIYFGEGDLEKSYILFMKFSNLVLDKLPKHSEYGRIEFSAQKTRLKELCRKSIEKLEIIRPKLEKSYQDFLEQEKKAVAEAEKLEAERLSLKEESDRLRKLKLEQTASSSNIKSSTELPTYQSVIKSPSAPIACSTSNHSLSASYYPSCNTLPNPIYLDKDLNNTLKSMQERMGISSFDQSKSVTDNLNHSIATVGPPRYFSESGEVLRPVHIPQSLISKFLNLAAQNTYNNLETCGVLAGKLHHNEFTITCLIIPKQVATSDTCAMINEEEIITAQDSLDVMSLGWIHTHPTQKCFLSSVDLHTHMPFQLLMAEAVAIVCAPTQSPNFGIFRLTDPPGLEVITKCQHPSAFHPHPDNLLIYRELKGPESHAQLNSDLPLEVIDLRK